ncbi:auxin-induced protein X15-like [Glycine soja]|uniref:Auxin-responsive protein SAUR50 n=2 Tax=Glycine soja TaxID=3848 RepID=A0A445K3R8_GLYSO|nr:auxin-induced protein X15-like [Glycine soja]RZC05445.1 Auxin-responsive protein SAUR50 [Glycine soja]
MSLGKFNIVRLRQMLRRWRSKAHRIPSDVPAGHVAVCVGTNSRRFVVRATYLNHPVFKKLLVEAEEEYGFSNHGLLAIPCDEALFEQLLRFISRSDCHLALRNNLHFYLQSLPLLH